MLGEPLANLWMLVGGIVVDDRMNGADQSANASFAIAQRQFTDRSFLHLQGGTIEGRHHGLHQPVLGNVGVRTFVWFGEEGCRRNPVRRKRTSNQRALNHLEIESVQATVRWVLTKSREQFADHLAPCDDRAIQEMDL